MRAITAVALLALFALSSVSASLVQGASNKVAGKQSPWKIVEAWTKQMPGGAAMQIYPVYTATKGIYFTTSMDGTVYALNTTSREVLWSRKWDDITFIQAVDGLDGVVIGRGSATDVVQASSGGTLWSNSSIVILPDTANHGDRNFILFGNRMVYREKAISGFTRVCTLDIFSGTRYWCDTMRVMGLPDAAFNDTFTAPLFDSTGQAYAANFDVHTGEKNWILPVDNVLTGNQNYVAVANGTSILTLDSMTGATVANVTVGTSFTGTSTLVHTHILAVCDGQNWVAGFNAQLGYVMWNVSTPVQRGTMQLQHRGDGVLVLAVLTQKHTNFTRFDAYEGNFMWTVSARPVGTSLAPVHAWLGNDIIYVRDVTNSWSAFGVDTGDLISTGSGNLFLPRSVAADIFEPHVGYFVTGPEGIVYDLKIVPRN